jgi:hypothetical protein
LLQQLVYQGGFAVVDVRNNGDVSKVINHDLGSQGGARTLLVFGCKIK